MVPTVLVVVVEVTSSAADEKEETERMAAVATQRVLICSFIMLVLCVATRRSLPEPGKESLCYALVDASFDALAPLPAMPAASPPTPVIIVRPIARTAHPHGEPRPEAAPVKRRPDEDTRSVKSGAIPSSMPVVSASVIVIVVIPIRAGGGGRGERADGGSRQHEFSANVHICFLSR
jgi:hypothetical protein